jgi:hypothetical protein
MALILNGTDNSATTPAVTGTDTDTGVFFPTANVVAFSTSGTEDARFDSAGNLLIGTTSQAPLVGVGKYLTLYNTSNTTLSIQSVDSGNDRNATLELLSSGAGGSISQFIYGDTRTVSSTQSPLVFASYYSLTRTERLRLNTTGNLVLQGGNINATGVGVSFPATQVASSDANCLDDYEEGTFTPTAFGNTSAGTTVYGSQIGSYTKIGRQVTITVALQYSSLTGTGELRFGNFPFAINGSEYTGSIMTDNLNWTAGTSIVLYGIPGSTSSVIFGSADDTAWSPQQCVNETAGFRFTLTYFTS